MSLRALTEAAVKIVEERGITIEQAIEELRTARDGDKPKKQKSKKK